MTAPAELEAANAVTAAGNYRSILKSTSLIGGASVLNILIGMVKVKFVATLLGPSGVGLMSMYTQIAGLVSTVSGVGLSNSGVRQVAEAVGTGDGQQIARTVFTLRRTVWLTGGIGMLIMVLFCIPIAELSFKSGKYALPIALLGVTVLLSAITCGQACVLQGTRRIADLAKISILGAVNGTVISIPCFYLWGEQGIVVSLILCSIASLFTSWWFARRVPIGAVKLPWSAIACETRRLMVLGFSFMAASLVTMLSNYLIQIMLLHKFGINSIGIYQAAFSLSGILVGFVLGAMGTDYYPRLTAVIHDKDLVRQMVNEQSEISILLALPALAAMMVCAPLVLRVFYAKSFIDAVPILRWCLLGVLGRVFSWPLGFVVLARGNGRLFFITELIAATVHLAAIFSFTNLWGLKGAGIAFMALYAFYTVMMLSVVHRLAGIAWTRHTWHLALTSTAAILILMLNSIFNKGLIAEWATNIILLAVVSYFCIKHLFHKSGFKFNAKTSSL